MAKDFNNPMVVDGYDEHIRKLIPGYELIHLQVHALLESYFSNQTQVNVLIVGCGTGFELQYLMELFPLWQFTAIDPAENMLEKAKLHIDQLGLSKRVQFILGDTSVLLSLTEKFDVALAILVSHFVPTANKAQFFDDISNSLSKAGLCLSYELTQIVNARQLETLKILAIKTGLSEKQAEIMANRIDQDFALISVDQMKHLYREAGFVSVDTFAQVLNYCGFIGFKN